MLVAVYLTAAIVGTFVGYLRCGQQKLQTRLSTDADPHRLLLLQEHHSASWPLSHRLIRWCLYIQSESS